MNHTYPNWPFLEGVHNPSNCEQGISSVRYVQHIHIYIYIYIYYIYIYIYKLSLSVDFVLVRYMNVSEDVNSITPFMVVL